MIEGLLAVIGGTGLNWHDPTSPLQSARPETVTTRWGEAHLTRASLQVGAPGREVGTGTAQREIVFLNRHAGPGCTHIPPHRINYRANIAALKKLGVSAVIATNAVGSLHASWGAGSLLCLDNFIDCTTGRAKTFFDEGAIHIDATQPYCARLRALLLNCAAEGGPVLGDGATYLCTDGPRFETAAEIAAFARWGADVVGMTGVPEVTLAREANIAYAAIAIVTNAAAGVGGQTLTQAEVATAMKQALPGVGDLIIAAANAYTDDPQAPSRQVTAEFGWPEVF